MPGDKLHISTQWRELVLRHGERSAIVDDRGRLSYRQLHSRIVRVGNALLGLGLAKGDRITFTNEDDVIHNIHIFGPGDDQKDLGLQKPVRRSATSSTRPAPTWSAATSIHR